MTPNLHSIRAPHRRSAPPGAQRGVLLLEALISILIFSLGLLGLVAIQARAIQFSVDAEDRSRASLLANEIVTAMWLKQSTDVSDLGSDFSDWQSRLDDPSKGGLPNGDQSITTDANGVATIRLTWSSNNRRDPDDPSSVMSVTHAYETKVVIPLGAI